MVNTRTASDQLYEGQPVDLKVMGKPTHGRKKASKCYTVV